MPKQGAAHAAARQRKSKLAAPLMIVLCLVMGVLAVLLVPVFVGGSPKGIGRSLPVVGTQHVAEVTTWAEGEVAAGFTAPLPALPEGATLTACRVLDERVLEADLSLAGGRAAFRAAPGNEDVSGDYQTYTFTTAETVGGVTRNYAGTSAEKLNLVIWTDGNNSYALVSPGGLEAAVMRQMAESIG